MANVLINGTLYPVVADEATHTDEYGKGGFRSVADGTARLAIPAGFLSEGMLVLQNSDGSVWKRVGSTWEEGGNIGDGSVTADKIDINAVTTTKLQNSAVTSDKLAINAVTIGKLASDAVTNNNLANGAAMEFDDDTIHNANAPTTATAIDLSATIGSTDGLLVIAITNNGATTSTYKFGPGNATVGNDIYDVGIATLAVGSSERGLITVHTNDSGILDWISSASVSTELELIGHIR